MEKTTTALVGPRRPHRGVYTPQRLKTVCAIAGLTVRRSWDRLAIVKIHGRVGTLKVLEQTGRFVVWLQP